MYAILQHGGRQYRVGPGDRLLVDRLDAEVGAVVALEPILFLHEQEGEATGSSDAGGSRMAATVVSHRRGKKLRVFKYKPKKRYRRTIGYRSDLTELRVESLVARGEALPKPAPAKAAAPAAAPAKPGAGKAATETKATAGEAKSAAAAAAGPARKPAAKTAGGGDAAAAKPARRARQPKPTTSEEPDDGA